VGQLRHSFSIASTRERTAGSVTFAPSEVPTTIVSVSPACFGAADWSRSMALVDSVFGRSKEFE
jgi:hypothetical protein